MREEVKWSQNKQQQHQSHYTEQKDEHEIENSEFIQAKGVKRHAFKEIIFHDFEKSIHNIQNKPTTKEKMSFRIGNHKIYTIKSNNLQDNFTRKNFKIIIG